ncbi:MAG: hypothetical protein P8N99_02395 [Luminiphilus sp.]|nr:hypothetical protein [Luminiphilus sp.]
MRLAQLLPARYQVHQSPLKTERWVELVALIVLGLVGLRLLLGLFGLAVDGGPEPLRPAQDSLAVQTLQLDEGLPPDQGAEILSRPLFWQSRRPLAPPPKVVVKPKVQAPQKLNGVVLHGVYGIGDGLGLIATVDGRMTRIAKGQSVKGWQLKSYENGVARFSSGGKKASLPLALTTPSVSVISASQGNGGSPDSLTQGERGLTFGGGSSVKSDSGGQ